jgi:hypothetical protein
MVIAIGTTMVIAIWATTVMVGATTVITIWATTVIAIWAMTFLNGFLRATVIPVARTIMPTIAIIVITVIMPITIIATMIGDRLKGVNVIERGLT